MAMAQISLHDIVEAQMQDAQGKKHVRILGGGGVVADHPNLARATAIHPSKEALVAEHGPVEDLPMPEGSLPLSWHERVHDSELAALGGPTQHGAPRIGLCEKSVTMDELADLFATVIGNPELVEEVDLQGANYQRFVTEAADLLTRHFGGQRKGSLQWAKGSDQFVIRVAPGGENAPLARADGGLWAPVDPDVNWGRGAPQAGDLLITTQTRNGDRCKERAIPKGRVGLIRAHATDRGTLSVYFGLKSQELPQKVFGGKGVYLPCAEDRVVGLNLSEVKATGRVRKVPFSKQVPEDDKMVWKTVEEEQAVFLW